ncbi:hypothetical protein AB0H82_00115 [Streptomyces sp. NPDC050732]|uniref:hypothetical protein n=1 Tax=Streptomyces sp. NPDC050732 TaxID=3154632 RepID=UPI003430DD43
MYHLSLPPRRLRPGPLPPVVRRLRATARTARFRLERAAAGRQRGPAVGAGRRGGGAPLLVPVHFSLRDSRTLNLALRAEGVLGGPGGARLVLARGPRRVVVPLAREARLGGVPLLTATVTLRGMGDGVWRVTVETRNADGRVRHHGLAPVAPVAPVTPTPPLPPPPATPTTPHAPDPLTGTLVRIVRARSGRAVLQATRSRARAELVRFVPAGDGITVHGRLVSGRRPGRPEKMAAVAVRRRDGVVVPADVAWHGDAFTLRVPFGAMAGAGGGQWVWDFRVGPLPLGRWLTDVRDPSTAYPTPFRVFALPDGALVRAHAHFTRTGAFAVTCWDITTEATRKPDRAPEPIAATESAVPEPDVTRAFAEETS